MEIPGKDISSLNDYLKFIEKALRFPTCCNGIYSRYHDWIMDLSWFDYNKYFLVFNDFSCFLRDEPDYKRIIFKDFEDVILPWWEHNVTKYSVDGREKIMIVLTIPE